MLEIADICIEIVPNPDCPPQFTHELEACLCPRFDPFISRLDPDFTITTRRENSQGSYDISTLGSNGKILVIEKDDSNRSKDREIGFIDIGNSVGEIAIPLENGSSILANYLRVVVESILARRCGFLLHACGVVRAGKSYLFVGPPDSGKTTVAKASNGLDVISDDCVAVRQIDDSFYCFGTPWANYSSSGSGPLKDVFLLQKAKHLDFRKVTAPLLMHELFGQTRLAHVDTDSATQVMNSISQIVASVPGYEMSFSLNDDIWRGIDQWGL